MFRLDYIECLGIFLASFTCVVLGQDRIIVSNLDEAHGNSSLGNDIIPETLLIQLKDVRNVSDLLRRFVTFEDSLPGVTMTNGSDSRRALSAANEAIIAGPANCKTELHVVELDKPENGATIFWPSCVRVRRCGGCCTSQMLQCNPLATSVLNVTVLQMHYNLQNPGRFESEGTRIFSLEQHDRCACSCKEGPEHCNPEVHDYRANECRCVCKNTEQLNSCTGSRRIWDSRDCLCKCRNIRLCSTGLYFNILTCRCEILRRSLAVENLSQYN